MLRELSALPFAYSSFLGLKNALDTARIEQKDAALELIVQLRRHQTRYLLAYLSPR